MSAPLEPLNDRAPASPAALSDLESHTVDQQLIRKNVHAQLQLTVTEIGPEVTSMVIQQFSFH